MSEKIKMIVEYLQALIEDRRIIARCELLHRIYELVRRADLDASEREKLESMVGKRLAPGIFTSIMSGAPPFELIGVASSITLHNRIFQYVECYSQTDYERAYNQFLNSTMELRELVILDLKTVLLDFMTDAGYHLEEESPRRVLFTNQTDQLDCQIYPSIKAMDIEKIEKTEKCTVLLVPQHGESPEPFIEFYKEKGRAIEEAELQIWVASLEEGMINPFIGYPKDINIYNQFKYPKLAMEIRSIWGIPPRPGSFPWWLPLQDRPTTTSNGISSKSR
ncbi:MAG: DUF6834 family protein [Methanotrichaceae archaeon]